ncbi:uncharacterized protein [Amphiura filiformis]|uniref:uncharacterized protein n=1 Tax=Amphiura filiformis TaxID=82378 RepID=UPI003B21964D
MNLHNCIRSQFGKDCLDIVRKLERVSLKIARYRNHLRFNLNCFNAHITPKSLHLSSAIKGYVANNILRKAERSLVNERIRQTNFTLDILHEQHQDCLVELRGRLPEEIVNRVIEFTKSSQLHEHEQSKARQVNKFRNLKNPPQRENRKGINGNWRERDGNTLTDSNKDKWVINSSSRDLSQDERSLLEKGLNFAVSPTELPVHDYIAACESACKQLGDGDADELRGKVTHIINTAKLPESNLTKEERKALENLRKDNTIIVLPADKGRACCVIDRTDYESKVDSLLSDDNTYERLCKDPTEKYKKELSVILNDLKSCGAIDFALKERLFPTECDVPKIYGLPKVHKTGVPLRPIVSSIGSVSYNSSRFLADILSSVVGKTPHHIKDTKQFVDFVSDLNIAPDELIVSYDVTALFTSVPVDNAIEAIRARLEEDTSWKTRTYLNAEQVLRLLKFCLNTTYFVFRGQFFKQKHGAAMGGPVSPTTCNLFMEQFESLALESAPHPPRVWLRYVDDTFVVIKREHFSEFTEHINSQSDHIKFTSEVEADGQLPFLDTLVKRSEDGSLRVSVYRKPTHTDQYLNFDSHHPLEHKLSVIRTLFHRADFAVTDPLDREKEISHVQSALQNCGYERWTFHKARKPKKQTDNSSAANGNTKCKANINLPYVRVPVRNFAVCFSSMGFLPPLDPSPRCVRIW